MCVAGMKDDEPRAWPVDWYSTVEFGGVASPRRSPTASMGCGRDARARENGDVILVCFEGGTKKGGSEAGTSIPPRVF